MMMSSTKFHIYQIQAIAEKALKQRLNETGQPLNSILPLGDWREITRQGQPYPAQLYQLLFGESKVEDEFADGIMLQLMPSRHLSTVADVLGIANRSEEARIDWLHALPWETMLWYFWQQSENESFADWMVSPECKSIIRTYWQAPHIDLADATEAIGWQLNILFAAAEPPSYASLEAEQQLQAMQQVFESVNRDGYPNLSIAKYLPKTRIEQIVEALSTATKDHPIHIVHLIAHGKVGADGIGRIVLVDSEGRSVEENVRQIKQAIEKHYERTKQVPFLFVINACFSDSTDYVRIDDSIARSLAETGIPYIVANQFAIKVGEMHSFTHAFYEQIALWQPIHKAVMAGRRAILEEHDKDSLASVQRSLPTHYQKRPRLLDTDGGMPGWAVPILYMRRDMDGHLPKWSPPSHILWPLDNKVMVQIQYGGQIIYVDETPVTRDQYDNVSSIASTDPRTMSLAEVRENLDDGIPKTDITPHNMLEYCDKVKKRLITKEVWLHLAALDPAYDAEGIYTNHGCGHCGCEKRGSVRQYKNHTYLWDFSGNSYEIVADADDVYYKVSSSFMSRSLYAFSRNDFKTSVRASQSSPHVGFRTMITLNDVLCLDESIYLLWFNDENGA